MTYQFENESALSFSFDWEPVARAVINKALDFEKCPYECEVNLLLTDDRQMRQINKEFRQADRATDVLSFPLIDYPSPSSFSHLEDALQDCFNPDSGELMLGDIVVSAEKVREQARAYGHSEKREFAFLIAHSMLHLLGYDHITEKDEMLMISKQEEILKGLKITRENKQ